MIVTIWRHGEAGSAVSDQQRELTDSGIDDVGFGCQQFQQICQQRGMPQPEHILHSSWVRTTQTAGIIASAFAHATLTTCQALLPGGTPGMVDTALDEIQTAIRRFPSEHRFFFLQGAIYQSLGESGRMNESMEMALKLADSRKQQDIYRRKMELMR